LNGILIQKRETPKNAATVLQGGRSKRRPIFRSKVEVSKTGYSNCTNSRISIPFTLKTQRQTRLETVRELERERYKCKTKTRLT